MSSRIIDVVTVGHVLVDIRLLVDKFPEPDEEAQILRENRGVGGSAANVAIAVRRLGLKPAIIAKIGLDGFGRIAVDELLRERVDISGLKISPTLPTGFSVVARDSMGRIVIYGFKGASENLKPEDIDENLIERARFIHIPSLRPDTSVYIAKLAKNMGKVVSWDPGRRLASLGIANLKELIKHVDIVFANEREAQLLTGIGDYREAARKIKNIGPQIVVVKKGAEGAYMLSDNIELDIPAYKPPKVVDTTGAGDAFAAGFITALIRNYDLAKALKYASLVASLKVSKLGSHTTPTLKELIEYAKKYGVEV